jgi:hypothetical protein
MQYGEIPKARGAVILITRNQFRDMQRCDIREVVEYRPGDPDTRRPTKWGVNLPVAKVPALLTALQKMEADAIADGTLKARHYIEAGAPVPAALRQAA